MDKNKFEIGKKYYSLAALGTFECIERTEETVTFKRENGEKHTLKIRCGSGSIEVEYACIGYVYLSSMFFYY